MNGDLYDPSAYAEVLTFLTCAIPPAQKFVCKSKIQQKNLDPQTERHILPQ
jgi:hypothetical protein